MNMYISIHKCIYTHLFYIHLRTDFAALLLLHFLKAHDFSVPRSFRVDVSSDRVSIVAWCCDGIDGGFKKLVMATQPFAYLVNEFARLHTHLAGFLSSNDNLSLSKILLLASRRHCWLMIILRKLRRRKPASLVAFCCAASEGPLLQGRRGGDGPSSPVSPPLPSSNSPRSAQRTPTASITVLLLLQRSTLSMPVLLAMLEAFPLQFALLAPPPSCREVDTPVRHYLSLQQIVPRGFVGRVLHTQCCLPRSTNTPPLRQSMYYAR